MAENREKRHTEKCAWFLVHAMNEHILFMHSAGVTVTPSEEETLKKKQATANTKLERISQCTDSHTQQIRFSI